MEKEPDYVGSWMLPDDSEQQRMRQKGAGIPKNVYESCAKIGLGSFLMFIETRQKQGSLEKITGNIIDFYLGMESTFKGELSTEKICFTKRYSEKFVDACIVPNEIPYEGRKVGEGIFRGTYSMETDGWTGQFILKEYFDPSGN